LLLVPHGYTSGSPLSGSATFNDATPASLGLTPGTYTYTWNSFPLRLSFQDDSLTVKIGSIPEPSTWAMMLIGFACLGFAGYRAARESAGVAA
jgi:hypothetical protein